MRSPSSALQYLHLGQALGNLPGKVLNTVTVRAFRASAGAGELTHHRPCGGRAAVPPPFQGGHLVPCEHLAEKT